MMNMAQQDFSVCLTEYLALRADEKIIKDIRERSYKLKELANSFE